MLKVSTRGEYGSRMMVQLARQWGAQPLALSEVAAQEHLSLEYLEQLAVALRKAGLITSHRGVHGGYTLARAPEQISMGEVLRALEGPIAPMVCVSEGTADTVCVFEGHCSTRHMWLQVGKAISGVLDSMSLADLVPVRPQREPVQYFERPMGTAIQTAERGLVAQHG
ncbi:MAG TPA: Rrf2 family transcriptional regulator [Chloroflexota bacterium]|jgi:Rrf2 family protein|nr:Rrf2 family transcriptional regulator [Chloroflexota bacterium]